MQEKSVHPGPNNFTRVLSRIPFALITAFLFAFLVNNRNELQYDFTLGKSWSYDDLDAPFNFPIRKDPASVAQEEKPSGQTSCLITERR